MEYLSQGHLARHQLTLLEVTVFLPIFVNVSFFFHQNWSNLMLTVSTSSS